MPYLYGFNINSIQSYIFQTGKLKEIIGASELVDYICKDGFIEQLGSYYKPEKLVQSAAGRVRYIFDDERSLQDFVLNLAIEINKKLPGVSFSQAAVKLKGDMTLQNWNELEKRLEIQKNIPITPHNPGLMIADRSVRTGGPLYKKISGEEVDESQYAKIAASHSDSLLFEKFIENTSSLRNAFSKDFEDLLPPGNDSGWLAVIHADGNGLGKLIQELLKTLSDSHPKDLIPFLRDFSTILEEATSTAVKIAFETVAKPVYEIDKTNTQACYIPLRPIILGGDDLSLIIRGNLALEFTAIFLKSFEEQTKLLFSPLAQKFNLSQLNQGMNACAGISYIKHHYPFHYATNLSNSLCDYAKNTARSIDEEGAPSCLAFHKVQSSFVGEYDDLLEGSLSIPEEDIQLNNSPYFLNNIEGIPYHSIDQLKKWLKEIKKTDAPKGNLREWLTELKISTESANQLLDRIIQVNPKYEQKLGLNNPFPNYRPLKPKSKNQLHHTHIYDIINLASL